MNKTRILSLLIVVGLLAGCGFHLRGNSGQPLALESVWLSAQSAAEVGEPVSALLEYSGVALADSRAQAKTIVTLTEGQFDRRVLSVSPDTGKVQELALAYRVGLAVSENQGKSLMSKQWITVSRDFTFDSSAVLAKEQEETVLRKELLQDAANQVLRRLETIHN